MGAGGPLTGRHAPTPRSQTERTRPQFSRSRRTVGQWTMVDAAGGHSGIHKVQLLRYFAGEPMHLYAAALPQPLAQHEGEDGIVVMTRGASEVVGVIHHAWTSAQRPAPPWVLVSGTRGRITFITCVALPPPQTASVVGVGVSKRDEKPLHALGPNHGHRASGVRAELVGCQAEKCLLLPGDDISPNKLTMPPVAIECVRNMRGCIADLVRAFDAAMKTDKD